MIRKPKENDRQKIAVTKALMNVMPSAPMWGASPDIQAAAKAWGAAADAIEANARVIVEARAQLSTLEAAQRVNRQTWRVATKAMLAVVDVACKGRIDDVQLLGFDVLTAARIGEQATPSGFVTQTGSLSGSGIVHWQRGRARYGFLVQTAADPEDPATISARTPCSKTKYKLSGKPSSLLYFRAAAIDPSSPSGASGWSDWVVCTLQ